MLRKLVEDWARAGTGNTALEALQYSLSSRYPNWLSLKRNMPFFKPENSCVVPHHSNTWLWQLGMDARRHRVIYGSLYKKPIDGNFKNIVIGTTESD